MISFTPPYIPLSASIESLQEQGFALLNCDDFFTLSTHPLEDWRALSSSWNDLAVDTYLKDGGKYRKRKHASLIVQDNSIEYLAYRPHYQPLSYNALHGGMQRFFTPCDDAFIRSSAMQDLLIHLGRLFSQANHLPQEDLRPWFVEAHQFRIDTASGIGRPTPEGAHRDGVNYVGVLMVDRHQVKGGETRIFDAAGPGGQRFTLDQSWSLLILDDNRVLHETTPIQPLDRTHPENTWRDTLVLTYRQDQFLDAQP
jgi:hypothetical protein